MFPSWIDFLEAVKEAEPPGLFLRDLGQPMMGGEG